MGTSFVGFGQNMKQYNLPLKTCLPGFHQTVRALTGKHGTSYEGFTIISPSKRL